MLLRYLFSNQTDSTAICTHLLKLYLASPRSFLFWNYVQISDFKMVDFCGWNSGGTVVNASCDTSMLSRNLWHNQRPLIFEGQEIAETLSQDYIDRLVWELPQDDIVVSSKCLPLHIFSTRLLRTVSQLKIIMRELKTVYYRQDNDGCDHCGFTMVCAIILGLL